MSDTIVMNDVDVASEKKVKLQPPSMYNVVFFNDDWTPMEFVIQVLEMIFHKSFDDAYAITMDVHNNGRGIAGTYSREVASEKQSETMGAARLNGFPLLVDIEKQ